MRVAEPYSVVVVRPMASVTWVTLPKASYPSWFERSACRHRPCGDWHPSTARSTTPPG